MMKTRDGWVRFFSHFGFWTALALSPMVLSWADASEVNRLDQMIQSSLTPLSGEVAFERRSTLVPFSVCTTGSCPRSRPYWALVLRSGASKFELDQRFSLGSARAPEAIELFGILLRPGSRIALQAKVDLVSQSYGIMSQVQDVHFIMDAEIAGIPFDSMDLPGDRPVGGGFPVGWSCRSANEGVPTYYVDVVHESVEAGGLRQKVRILSNSISDPASFFQREIIDVSSRIQDGNLIFEGTGRNSPVRLEIENGAVAQGSGLHSALVWKSDSGPSPQSNIVLQCGRLRSLAELLLQ